MRDEINERNEVLKRCKKLTAAHSFAFYIIFLILYAFTIYAYCQV